MGFWRHSNGTRSLTHSILFKSNYTLYSYLPLNITFVQSAFYAYVWHILGGTSKAYIFLDTKEKPAEDGFYINGNILKNTDNIICKKWTVT